MKGVFRAVVAQAAVRPLTRVVSHAEGSQVAARRHMKGVFRAVVAQAAARPLTKVVSHAAGYLENVGPRQLVRLRAVVCLRNV